MRITGTVSAYSCSYVDTAAVGKGIILMRWHQRRRRRPPQVRGTKDVCGFREAGVSVEMPEIEAEAGEGPG